MEKKQLGKKQLLGTYKDEITVKIPDLAYRVTALAGATQGQLADVLGKSPGTIIKWKKEHPEFRKAVEDGVNEWHKGPNGLLSAVYKKAIGQRKTTVYRNLDKKTGEMVHTGTKIEKDSGDMRALEYMLKAYLPHMFSDKVDVYHYDMGLIEIANEIKRFTATIQRALELPTLNSEQEVTILRTLQTNITNALAIDGKDELELSKNAGTEIMLKMQNAYAFSLRSILQILNPEQADEVKTIMDNM